MLAPSLRAELTEQIRIEEGSVLMLLLHALPPVPPCEYAARSY